MSVIFAKVTTILTALSRTNLDWIRANQTESHNYSLVEQRCQGSSSGSGIFGLLVSNDAVQGYLR